MKKKECDFTYNITENLLLHDWVEAKRLGLGPVKWVDEGAAQTRVFSMTKVFSFPAPDALPPPSVQGLRSLEGPQSHSGRCSTLSCL